MNTNADLIIKGSGFVNISLTKITNVKAINILQEMVFGPELSGTIPAKPYYILRFVRDGVLTPYILSNAQSGNVSCIGDYKILLTSNPSVSTYDKPRNLISLSGSGATIDTLQVQVLNPDGTAATYNTIVLKVEFVHGNSAHNIMWESPVVQSNFSG
jgi:hypothetical protein